jgi:hypothetical protein
LQQLKAAGVEYYFFNPSTGDAPIFDAFVDEPAVTLIKGVQEVWLSQWRTAMRGFRARSLISPRQRKPSGVEAESVKDASGVKAALGRALRANTDGRPYLLDIHVQRDGLGAASQWYPPLSVADLRTRKV